MDTYYVRCYFSMSYEYTVNSCLPPRSYPEFDNNYSGEYLIYNLNYYFFLDMVHLEEKNCSFVCFLGQNKL